MKLYEIKNALLEKFFNLLDDEITPATLDALAKLETTFEEKAIALGAYIKNIQSDIDQMQEYIERMETKQQALKNKVKALKDYLVFNLKELDYATIRSPQFNINLSKSYHVVTDPVRHIPEKYMISETTFYPNKQLILEDLKKGKEIEGAALGTTYFVKIN